MSVVANQDVAVQNWWHFFSQPASNVHGTLPRVMKTKFPATVMVFGVVSSEDHIMPPHILEVGLKVNTKVYLDVLKSVVQLGGWR